MGVQCVALAGGGPFDPDGGVGGEGGKALPQPLQRQEENGCLQVATPCHVFALLVQLSHEIQTRGMSHPSFKTATEDFYGFFSDLPDHWLLHPQAPAAHRSLAGLTACKRTRRWLSLCRCTLQGWICRVRVLFIYKILILSASLSQKDSHRRGTSIETPYTISYFAAVRDKLREAWYRFRTTLLHAEWTIRPAYEQPQLTGALKDLLDATLGDRFEHFQLSVILTE